MTSVTPAARRPADAAGHRSASLPAPADRARRRVEPALRAIRWLRHLPDRLLHPVRRERARRKAREAASRLAADDATLSVCFVCHGNIYRSPYAERAFRRSLPSECRERVRVESAGFVGPGRPSPRPAVEAAGRRGVALDDHVSRAVTPELLTATDLVFAMTPGQVSGLRDLGSRLLPEDRPLVLALGDLDPGTPRRREIPDPYGGPEEAVASVFERIDRCVASVAEVVARATAEAAPGASGAGDPTGR